LESEFGVKDRFTLFDENCLMKKKLHFKTHGSLKLLPRRDKLEILFSSKVTMQSSQHINFLPLVYLFPGAE